MIVPTTTADAWLTPKSRASSRREIAGSGMIEVSQYTRMEGKAFDNRFAQPSEGNAERNYSLMLKLAQYPTPNVTAAPIITHQVHGTRVPSHKYKSVANPHAIPTIAPR